VPLLDIGISHEAALEQGPDDGGDVRLVRVVVEAGKKIVALRDERRLESSSSGSISMLTVDSGARSSSISFPRSRRRGAWSGTR